MSVLRGTSKAIVVAPGGSGRCGPGTLPVFPSCYTFDSFARTVASGWGNSTDNHIWVTAGSGTASVSSGTGTLAPSSGSNLSETTSSGGAWGSKTLWAFTGTVTVTEASPNGSVTYYVNNVLNPYQMWFSLDYANQRIADVNGFTVAMTLSSGVTYDIKWELDYTLAVQNVKVWPASGVEPSNWTIAGSAMGLFTADASSEFSIVAAASPAQTMTAAFTSFRTCYNGTQIAALRLRSGLSISIYPLHVTENAFGDPTKSGALRVTTGGPTSPSMFPSTYAPNTDIFSFTTDSTAGDGTGFQEGSGGAYNSSFAVPLETPIYMWATNTDAHTAPMYTDGHSVGVLVVAPATMSLTNFSVASANCPPGGSILTGYFVLHDTTP